MVIGYAQPHHILGTINKSNKEKTTELTNEFLTKLTDIQDEREPLSKLFLNGYEFEYATMHPLNKYMSYLAGSNQSEYNKRQVVEFLQQIPPETTVDNLDKLIKSGTFKSIDTILPIYEQTLQKYRKYSEVIKPYSDYVNGCNQLRSSLEKKYLKILVEQLKDIFSEEEYSQIQNTLNSRYYNSIRNVNPKTKNYIGYSLNGSTLIEAFNEENEKLLLNGAKWQQDSVKRDRIEYFKNFGLDLGDDYELYLNNPKVLELIPPKELIARILDSHKKLYNQMMQEYYLSLPEYQKNRSRIDEINLLDKEDGYDASAYEKEGTAITTNIKMIDGKYVEYPILLMYMGTMEEYHDSSLVHELNHVYELCLQTIENNHYQMTCGWDIVDGTINNQRIENNSLTEERKKRDYELFNEIINELISQEISEILSKMGVYIFNTQENKKIKGGTSYEKTMFLIKEFYEIYKDVIIASRKNGNMQILFNTIGKENFEDLNKLFHEYNENFNGFMIYKVYEDLKNGVETEKTKKLKELASRKNAILAKMEEHSHTKTSSL